MGIAKTAAQPGGLEFLTWRLILQYGDERIVDLQSATVAVVDVPRLPELVHEEVDARARRSDHVGQRILSDVFQTRHPVTMVAGLRKRQQRPRQALLAEMQHVVDQVLLNAAVARQ